MKITVEDDRNIIRGEKPDLVKYVFEENIADINELLDLFRRIAQTLTYSCGQLQEVDDE